MVWPALIAAGASLLGGLIGSKGAKEQTERQLEFSQDATARQIAAQQASVERQAVLNREAYEYALSRGPALEMAGLRRAGVNPMLRYGAGGSGTPVYAGGASAFNVSTPVMSLPNPYSDVGAGVAGAVSSAAGTAATLQSVEESSQRVASLRQEMDKRTEEIRQIQANTSLTAQQQRNAVAEEGRILGQTALQLLQGVAAEASANQMNAAAEQARRAADLLEQQLETEQWNTFIRRSEAPRAAAAADVWLSWLGPVFAQAGIANEAMRTSGLLGLLTGSMGAGVGGVGE